MGPIDTVNTLRALSDDKSLALFNAVAYNLLRDSSVLMMRLGIIKRQYYCRMSSLINAGLVMRKSGRYLLTSFGKVVYEYHILVAQAVEDYWRLKAIDAIEISHSDHALPAEERKRIVESLIERKSMKNILLNQEIPAE